MENRVTQVNRPFFGSLSESRFLEKNQKLLIDWTSGLLGGFASATICAPMDIARTRHMLLATTQMHKKVVYQGFFHTLGKIYKDEGVRGLYKGYNVTAFSIPVFHSLYFSLFYKMKEYFKQTQMLKNTELGQNLAGSCVAGFICNTLTNPMWIVRTRIQSQYLHPDSVTKYTGLFNGLSRIFREEGSRALFKGLGASYFGLSHAIILYPLYEHFKGMIKQHKETPSNRDIFFASLVSKFIAMVATYPHLVLRTRLQDQRSPSFLRRSKQAYALAGGINNKATISSIIKDTYRKEGIKGFYAGLRIDMVRVLPANSVMFVTFEFVKKTLEKAINEGRDY